MTAIYGGSAAQVDYRLVEEHGCDETQFGYHVDLRERSLEWIGSGLEEFGLRAGQELTAEQFDIARALVAGRDPFTGAQLVAGKQAIYDDAKLPGLPLVEAVRAAAVAARTTPAELLAAVNLDHAKRFARLERAVATHGAAALLRADHAGAIARAAGLDPDTVWGPGVHARAVANLTETVVDANGQLVVRPRRLDVGIKAFDLSITLPKSLSVLLAVAPEDTAAQIEGVYRGAVGRVFGWTEARTSYVLRGQHGDGHTAVRQRSSGFVGWVMVHRTARPVNGAAVGDPHWHVHITVANMVRGADGAWSATAAGGRDLMRHAAVIDKLTQAETRRVLHQRFGIEFVRSPRTGLWEVAAIPDATIRLFSKRGQQVHDVLAELGYAPGEASSAEERVRTRTSRTAKDHTTAASDPTLREHWHAQLATNPHQPSPFQLAYAALTPHAQPQQAPVSMDAIAAALAHPETGLTATRRRFCRLDVLARVADELPYGGDIAAVEAITDTVLQRPLFQRITTTGHPAASGAGPLGAGHMSDPQLYTTRDIPAAERTILTHAQATRRSTTQVPAETTRLAIATVEQAQGFALSAQQRAVVEAVCGSGRLVEAVVGPAGTGKTTVMRAARVAWHAAGHTVAGAATAAVAAQNLHTESGIPSATVAQWQHRITHGPGLHGVDVLVLDEANLTDDRARAQLYTAAAHAGTRIVEIGDPKQLRGVGAGSMFGHLHHSLDGPTLTENRRQHDPAARHILAQHRAGRYAEALHSLAGRGQLVATETPQQATAAIVRAYLQRAAGAPDPHTLARGLVVLAGTTEQVDRLNDTIQAARHHNHHTGSGHTYPAPHPSGRILFRVGDQVLLRRNDRAHLPGGQPRPDRQVTGDTVLNGYRGTITATNPHSVHVTWQTPGGTLEAVEVSPAYIAAGGLDLGYALTAHKAEGLTIGATWTHPDGTPHRGDVLVYGPGMDQAGQYVALSRPRGDVLLVGARTDLEPPDSLAALQHGPPAHPDQLTSRVITALAHQAAATADNANDRPVLVDLGETPSAATPHHARRETADREESPTERPPTTHAAAQRGAVESTPTQPTAGQTHTPSDRGSESVFADLDRQRVREKADAVRAAWAQQNRPHADYTDDRLARELAAARDQLAELTSQRDHDQQAHDQITAGYHDGHGPRETELLREAEHDNHRAALVEQARTIEKALKQATRHHQGATFTASEHGKRAQGARFYQHRTRNRALAAQTASEHDAADAARRIEREHAALIDTFTELGITPIRDNPRVRSLDLDAVERDIQRNRNNNKSYRLQQAREYDGDDLRHVTHHLNHSASALTHAEHTLASLTAELDTRNNWDPDTRRAATAEQLTVGHDNMLTSLENFRAQRAEQAREAEHAQQATTARRSHSQNQSHSPALDYEYTGYRTDPLGHSQGHGLGM